MVSNIQSKVMHMRKSKNERYDHWVEADEWDTDFQNWLTHDADAQVFITDDDYDIII
jgi:hypothetical protein